MHTFAILARLGAAQGRRRRERGAQGRAQGATRTTAPWGRLTVTGRAVRRRAVRIGWSIAVLGRWTAVISRWRWAVVRTRRRELAEAVALVRGEYLAHCRQLLHV